MDGPCRSVLQTVHVCREVIKVYGVRIFVLHLDAGHGLLGLSLSAISLQHTVPLVNREIIFLIHVTFFHVFLYVYFMVICQNNSKISGT